MIPQLIIAVLGFLVLYAVVARFQKRQLLRSGARVRGRIVDWDVDPGFDGGLDSCTPTVRFRDATGKDLELQTAETYTTRLWAIGTSVEVLYDPNEISGTLMITTPPPRKQR